MEMKWKWDDFSEKEQEKLGLQMTKSLPSASCEQIAEFLHVLIELKYPWKENHEIQEVFFNRMVHLFHDKGRIEPSTEGSVFAESFAQVVHSLGKAPKHTFQWDKLPKDFQNALLNGIEVYSPSFRHVDLGRIFIG
jgi:hypothetical protein